MKNKLTKSGEKYLDAFLIGFGIFLLILLPMLIANKGVFLYYGDYNSQQIPFYQLAHHALREGNLFWNWYTDLGANFIGSYSFYLLGSPFFWLTIPFPDGVEVYLMPVLLALKYGVASLTAYAYIRRFVKTPNAALIGALLYAFSGFQAYNVFFNHFHDVTAFFPLLLLALEQRVVDGRRGVFALAVALMGILSYFFFFGEVVFVVLYFIVRCFSKDFKMNLRKFLSIAFEAVVGVMLAAFLLLPAVMGVTGNPRVSERVFGQDLVLYGDKTKIARIIQSFFMVPDVPSRPNLFSADTSKWASIAGYLPMFSMAGVIAFFQRKKKHWASRMVILCAVMAFVPVLNSMFSGLTFSYYARWFYMPILIMAMMTAYSVDNSEVDLRFGSVFCAGVIGVYALIGCLPTKNAEGKIEFFQLPEYPAIFWAFIALSLLCASTLIWLVFYNKRGKEFRAKALFLTMVAVTVCTASIVGYGVALGPYPEKHISEGVFGKENISLPEDDGTQFWRIDISENYDNYAMSWGLPSMRCFQSVVPASIMEFYPTVGVTRDVASRAELTKYGLRGLFSVKYYFDKHTVGEELEKKFNMPGFEFYENQNGFDIYTNTAYVPMGFTFEHYISEEDYTGKNKNTNDRLLMKAIVLSDEQIERYDSILTELPKEKANKLTEADYLADCEARAATACTTFEPDTRGFTATTTLERDNLVFFSVPFEKGFTATVDGKPALLEVVDVGFMAVRVPAGTHTIRFDYTPYGLIPGMVLTGAGVVFLLVYLFIFRKEKAVRGVQYDYDTESEIPAKDAYEKHLIEKIRGMNADVADDSEKGE